MKKVFTILALAGAVLSSLSVCGAELRAIAMTRGRGEVEVKECFVAKTTQAGTLAEVLGERINDTDSIVVEGPINASDFKTLWTASLRGVMSVLNLEKATIVEGKIPAFAFFDKAEQIDAAPDGLFYTVWLRHIILGKGIEEIGDYAFALAADLETVTYTAPVRRLGKGAFYADAIYGCNPIVLPEGLEEIGDECFLGGGMFKALTLPSTLKRIGASAFYGKYLETVTIPESIEYMGALCFGYNKLRELVLPDKEIEYDGWGHFECNYLMEHVTIPTSMTDIPPRFLCQNMSLREVKLPEGVKTIGYQAFGDCTDLVDVSIPEGLTEIGPCAFAGCVSLPEIVLPASLETLGERSFSGCNSMKKVYSKAVTPPVCDFDEQLGPFASLGEKIEAELGVPTGASATYTASSGWDCFRSVVELSPEEFENLGGVDSVSASRSAVTVRGESGAVVIEGGRGESFAVVGADGRTAAQGRLSEGVTRVSAAPGVYIVKAGQETRKVAVR